MTSFNMHLLISKADLNSLLVALFIQSHFPLICPTVNRW